MDDMCTMCEQRPATTIFAFRVCDECVEWLGKLDGQLKQMEADDPELARLGQNVERSAQRLAWRVVAERHISDQDVTGTLARALAALDQLDEMTPLAASEPQGAPDA